MNRVQFITLMQKGLYPLDAQERKELISDYEQHFDIGLSEGKSEEEIALELGKPEDLIKEILGERYSDSHDNLSQDRWYTISSLSDDKSYYGAPYSRVKSQRPPTFTWRFFTAIGLLFLNLIIALPIFAVIWSFWISIAAASISGSLAPVLAVLDFTIQKKQVVLPEVFVSITLLGIGILIGIFALWLVKPFAGWTARYCRWNMIILKGRNSQL